MESNPHKGHQCRHARMRMTAVFGGWVPALMQWPEVFMAYYVIRPATSPLYLLPLYGPQRSLWGSSHLPRLSMEQGHICASANVAPGGRRNWDLLSTVTFSHTFSTTHDHTCAASIEAMNHPRRLYSFRLNCDNSYSDINGRSALVLIFTRAGFLRGVCRYLTTSYYGAYFFCLP